MTPMSVTANFAREGQGVTNRKLDITCITLTWKILLYLFHLYYLISPCRGSCWSWAPSSCYPNACCRPEINTWGVLSSFMCFKNPSCSKLVKKTAFSIWMSFYDIIVIIQKISHMYTGFLPKYERPWPKI